MAADISKVRKALSQASISVKQGKAVGAVQAVQDSINLLLSTPLMKSERTEFEQLINSALAAISGDALVRSLFPLQLQHIAGQERELLDNLRELMAALSEHVREEAERALREREEKKRANFLRGVEELATEQAKGQATFASLAREFPRDAQLFGEMGEALLKAKLYEEAVRYLTEALDQKPDMLPFYNIIGMALRKLEQYEVAETYYLRASQYLRHDPNLYFNIGRLYVDWKKWSKARSAAMAALKLNPDFKEAQKLLQYAESFIAKQ